MGYDYDSSNIIKICVIGGSKELINKLFPNSLKDDKYTKRKLTQKIEAKDFQTGKSSKYKINWEAYIFENMTDETEDDILHSIIYDIFKIPEEEKDNFENKNIQISKNNIIIKFGSNNVDIIFDFIDEVLPRIYYPQIAIITNDKLRDIKDNRFLTLIKEAIESELFKKIYNYLWERECYFNQRGQLISEYSPENLNPSKDLPCSSLNIMLTGMSRAGKSTFINVFSQKLISLETPEFLSVTTEINEYVVYKEVQEKMIKFKFIDTPGLTFIPEKNIDTTKAVIDSIDKKLKEFNDSNDSIHMIYFFMAGIPNLEQVKKFFTYLNDLNTERIKQELPKIPILFIFNHNSDKNNYEALKKFLIDNNYNNLYEKGEKVKTERNKIRDKINFKRGKSLNIIEDNIIGINLLKLYNNGIVTSNVFGVSELLRATKYFIKKTNPFKKEDFDKLNFFAEKFKNFSSMKDRGEKLTKNQEEELKSLKENCKDLTIKISKENTLLYKLNDQNKIIEKAEKESYKIIYTISALGFMVGCIPVPFLDLGLLVPIYITMITKIGNCFSVRFSEISNKTLLKLVFGLEADVQSGAKFVGNAVGASAGEKLGKDLVKDIGKDQVKDWSQRNLRLVSKFSTNTVPVDVVDVGESLLVNNEGKFKNFINYIYNLFPSFQDGVKKGIDLKVQKYGDKVADIIIENTVDFSEEYAKEHAGKLGQLYGQALASNANGTLSNYLPKFIPVIGSLIGGAMDSYSTYKVGKNSIKYFIEYLKKTMGCEFILKRKEEYETALNSLDIIATYNFENFEINIQN